MLEYLWARSIIVQITGIINNLYSEFNYLLNSSLTIINAQQRNIVTLNI